MISKLNSRGVALMMVISAIMVISMIVLEFVYSSNVNYQLAINAKERLQAEYLAQSGLNLVKLELKLDQQIKSMVSSSNISQFVTANVNDPICKMFPFSSALFRNIDALAAAGGAAEGQETENKTTKDNIKEAVKEQTMFTKDIVDKFLSFDGDFNGECEDEQSKFNLNSFASFEPEQQSLSGTNSYDVYKRLLVNFLKQDRFKDLFNNQSFDKYDEIVRNIADWVDKNDVINDYGNMGRGSESAQYKNGEIPPRNGKFLSLDELHLVEGVDDDWLMPMQDLFTVYGDGKVNVCVAPEEVVWSLILSYASQNPNVPVINPLNTELKNKLITSIQLSCGGVKPDPNKIASDLDAALGLTAGQGGGTFANLISTTPQFYTLKTSGQVGNTVVNIEEVVDIKNTDPKKWRTLYYRVY